MKAKLFKTDGTVIEIAPKNGTDFTLEECYEHICCELVEVARTWDDDMILIVDEEGLVRGSHYNFDASSLAIGGHIVGDAIYCHNSMLR